MSRYERDDISHLNLPDPISTRANYYIKDGEVIKREKYNTLKHPAVVCCKEIQHIETKITTYYVLCNGCNQMFDPHEQDTRYKVRSQWKFRRVNRSTFDLYTKFLRQHYKSLLSQAERGL